MDRYKEINLELTLKNKNLLELVNLLKQEIIKLNRSLQFEKEKTQFLKSQIAKIIRETSEKIVQVLSPQQDEITKTANNISNRRSSTSVLKEVPINENQDCSIRRTQTPPPNEALLSEDSENIRPRDSIEAESSRSKLKLVVDNVTCRPRRQVNIFSGFCENDVDLNGENSDSDTSRNSNISDEVEDMEEDCEADVLDEVPLVSASPTVYSLGVMPTIIEEPNLAENNELNNVKESSCIVEDTDNLQPMPEDENEHSSPTNDLSYSQISLTGAISSTPFKRKAIDEKAKSKDIDEKAMSNVKVVLPRLKTEYLLKLGIDWHKVFQRNKNSHKVNSKHPKRPKTSKTDERIVGRRPQRKAAPVKIIEPSLIKKLRQK